jgi:PAS domain S-box-containing protein
MELPPMPHLRPIISTLDAVPTGMILNDLKGVTLSINPPIEDIFGYTRSEIRDQAIEILVPERLRGISQGHRQFFIKAPSARTMGAGRDLYGRHKDGRDIPIEIGLNPIQASQDRYVFSSVIDLSVAERFRLA